MGLKCRQTALLTQPCETTRVNTAKWSWQTGKNIHSSLLAFVHLWKILRNPMKTQRCSTQECNWESKRSSLSKVCFAHHAYSTNYECQRRKMADFSFLGDIALIPTYSNQKLQCDTDWKTMNNNEILKIFRPNQTSWAGFACVSELTLIGRYSIPSISMAGDWVGLIGMHCN